LVYVSVAALTAGMVREMRNNNSLTVSQNIGSNCYLIILIIFGKQPDLIRWCCGHSKNLK